MAQGELFKAETMWFHVFKDMIDSGDMARLEGGTNDMSRYVFAHVRYRFGF